MFLLFVIRLAPFYRGLRIGRHSNLFGSLKFRIMVENAEKIGGSSTSEGDLRITRARNVIREHKLDENVVRMA